GYAQWPADPHIAGHQEYGQRYGHAADPLRPGPFPDGAAYAPQPVAPHRPEHNGYASEPLMAYAPEHDGYVFGAWPPRGPDRNGYAAPDALLPRGPDHAVYAPEPPAPYAPEHEAYASDALVPRGPDHGGYAPEPLAPHDGEVAELPEPHPLDPADADAVLPDAPPVAGLPRRGRRPSRRRRSRAGRAVRACGVLLVLVLGGGAGAYAWADSRLDSTVNLAALPGRPAPGKGTNYLIVGSDSRAGLTARQAEDLHTGSGIDAEGRRTDSMMVLHTGAHGTTITSLPRDSWVVIPAYVDPRTGIHHRAARNKLNAAFSLGGPELLVRTIESNTGLRLDHYTEIGFAGFVGIVDAVGGVRMCVDRHVVDEKSGLDLTRGCHTLSGRQALAFVRQRHQEKQGDLGRSRNQRKFLAALAAKAASRDVLLNPSALVGTAGAGLSTLIVDSSTGLPRLTRLFEALQDASSGRGKQLNVPISGFGVGTSKGSVVVWDKAKSRRLFAELRADRPVTVTG
ncbi:LCP family protein, partial [Streptomyces benahoarensis]|uniref:LCP family protein n=1 Tax=Streptomyces benahoarensis TaxID=2595054 RepID=UPI003D804AD1